MSETTEDERLGAFVEHCDTMLPGAPDGLLSGLTFATKDIFDVAGCRTGCGNPDWLRTHPVADRSAPVVERLVAAGASMVGKTVTEELAYSLIGENAHYGAPVNVNAPGRVAGGSSSGSAAAVAGGLASFALGSDTGGSVRIPASFCGIYGLRPTHDRIPLEGIMPLAASYDTIGWFARDPSVMAGVGRVLFDNWREHAISVHLLVPEDAWAVADPAVQAALGPALDRLAEIVNPPESVVIANEPLDFLATIYMTLQGREAWLTHRKWVESVEPKFGPGIAERFRMIAAITDDAVGEAQSTRESHTARMLALVPEGCVMALPTAPCIAPLRGSPADILGEVRRRILMLTGIAGHAGLPQLSLPVATVEGCPVGLSIIAAPGADEVLLSLAREF